MGSSVNGSPGHGACHQQEYQDGEDVWPSCVHGDVVITFQVVLMDGCLLSSASCGHQETGSANSVEGGPKNRK